MRAFLLAGLLLVFGLAPAVAGNPTCISGTLAATGVLGRGTATAAPTASGPTASAPTSATLLTASGDAVGSAWVRTPERHPNPE